MGDACDFDVLSCHFQAHSCASSLRLRHNILSKGPVCQVDVTIYFWILYEWGAARHQVEVPWVTVGLGSFQTDRTWRVYNVVQNGGLEQFHG